MTQAPLEEEHKDLCTIAQTMQDAVSGLKPRLESWREDLAQGLDKANTPLTAEGILDQAVLALRHVWLEAAASSTSKSYRSPAEGEKTTTPAGRFHNFGYERDLQPVALERRCADFFEPPPPGWRQDHVLFSSGQAAMNAILTLLSAGQDRRLSLRHDGCYFETTQLLRLYQRQFDTAPGHGTDIVIAEPVWCDGKRFGATLFEAIAKRANTERTTSIIVDSTLAGLDDRLNNLLGALDGTEDVFRLHSGLKLFQAGLELADVGIVSLYGSAKADDLRRIRTLQGTGLRFADVAALELPLFLDPAATLRYEDAVFWHNGALAEAARGNPAFTISYPVRAPFVIANLPTAAAYEGLDEKITAEAGLRSLVFTKGGSFGFRGHRFETVRPDGKPPFLRIAMGKRAGPSFEGILELFRTFRP